MISHVPILRHAAEWVSFAKYVWMLPIAPSMTVNRCYFAAVISSLSTRKLKLAKPTTTYRKSQQRKANLRWRFCRTWQTGS